MSKNKLVITLIAISLAAVFFLKGPRLWHVDQNIPSGIPKSEYIDYSAHKLNNFQENFSSELGTVKNHPIAGITSHHLPTAEGFINDFYASLKQARPEIKNFLIVGPDHFERCKYLASITKKDFLTPFGVLSNNQEFGDFLEQSGASENSDCFKSEHSVGVQTTFIKKYFPESKVSALIFSSALGEDEATKFAEKIFEKDSEIFVVCSTDFSHYQGLAEANLVDLKTGGQIKTLDYKHIQLKQIDSPSSLVMILKFAELSKSRPEYLVHKNSYDFNSIPTNTTGYFNVIFSRP